MVKKGKLWKCKIKGCKFQTTNNLLKYTHKRSCALRINKLKPHQNRNRQKNVFQEMDFRQVLVGSMISKGGYGVVKSAKIGNLQIVIKNSYGQDREKISSFSIEKEVLQKIHFSRYRPGFPRLFKSQLKQKRAVLYLEKLDYTVAYFLNRVHLKLNSLISMMVAMLNRIESLHSCGYVHRDLKLNNFMFKNGYIYLIDFGSCRIPSPQQRSGSIFGNIAFLSKRSHLFIEQGFGDDLQNLGWIFLDIVSQDLPWNQLVEKYQKEGRDFQSTAQQIEEMKAEYLSKKGGGVLESQFVIQFLKQIRDLPYIGTFDRSLYAKMRRILNRHYLGKAQYGEKDLWKIVLKTDRQEQIYAPPVNFELPLFCLGYFSISVLPMYFKSLHELKKPLDRRLLIGTCRQIGKVKELNCQMESSKQRLLSTIDQGNLTLWILMEGPTPGEEVRYSVYLSFTSNGGNRIISFDDHQRHPYFESFNNLIEWKFVKGIVDAWQTGYLAIFWVMEVNRFGCLDRWLDQNGFK